MEIYGSNPAVDAVILDLANAYTGEISQALREKMAAIDALSQAGYPIPHGADDRVKSRLLTLRAWEDISDERFALAQEAVQLDPTNTDARLILNQQLESPLEDLEAIVTLAKQNCAHLGADDDDYAFAAETQPLLRALYQLALAEGEEQKFGNAIATGLELIALFPHTPVNIREWVMCWYVISGQGQEAMEYYRESLEFLTPMMLYAKATLDYQHYGDDTVTEASCEEALKANPYMLILFFKMVEAMRDNQPFEMPYEDAEEEVAEAHRSLGMLVQLWHKDIKLLEIFQRVAERLE